jgi:hypothetical protein
MNIIKLQDELRGVPDNALIGYVQNPTGHVPSYLALSELQRRKDMRAKYQQQQAPESSVADDLEQEATPQVQPQEAQGVASLPVPETMYQEDSFASGGIVAFDDGGGVKYDDGSVGYPIGGYIAPALMATGKAAAKYGEKGLKYLKDKALVGKPAVTGPTMNLPTGPVTPVLETATKGFLKTPGSYLDAAVIGGVLYGIDEYGNKEQITEEEASKIAMQKLEAENFKSMQDNTATREAREKANADLNQKQVKYGDKPANTKDTTTQAAQQPAESEDDFLRRRMAIYKEYMGGDEDKKGLKDKLDKMEARAARQEELAPYMALTEAGFKTMQGTSPYALANFGAGAEAGIKSYGGAQDKMAALEEKRYALMNDAAKADRSERQAAITFGENSYQHKAAMDQKDRIANMGAALKEKEIGLGYAKINSDSNLIKMGNFGLKEQLAIDKYVKDQMGSKSIQLNVLRQQDPTKLDEKKKATLKTLLDEEARIQKEAMQKFNINSLADRARSGSAGTTYKSSDYTVEELPGL